MTYRVLYREWRPENFANLVGQNHICTTLCNALAQGRIAHAYLFTGPRGTGKTSTAKILAKAVNCKHPQGVEPCNECVNCLDVNTGCSLDVLEIDAASNRGIEEIRELKEGLNFVPSQGKYKVYIIDEVHMLTTEAFNALLKTLEEPPSHVLFVLATTDPQKIPATILSRCQRFDFKKISLAVMRERLQVIIEEQEITVEDGVLELIIKKAEGSLRDAISILDQCISSGDKQLTLQNTYEVLGLIRNDVLLSLFQAIIAQDTVQVLKIVNEILQKGTEPGQVIKDLLEYLHNLLILHICGFESSLIFAEGQEKEQMIKQSRELGVAWLSRAIDLLLKLESESRWCLNLRIALETSLISLIYQTGIPPKLKTLPDKTGDSRTVVPKTVAPKTVAPKTIDSQTVNLQIVSPQIVNLESRAVKSQKTTPQQQVNKVEESSKAVSLALVKEKWPEIMETIKENKKTLYAFLVECVPYRVTGNNLMLLFKSGYTFHKDKVEEMENNIIMEEALTKLLGVKLKVKCHLADDEQE